VVETTHGKGVMRKEKGVFASQEILDEAGEFFSATIDHVRQEDIKILSGKRKIAVTEGVASFA
jgi:hypothetical protein